MKKVSSQKQRQYTDTNNIQEESVAFKINPKTLNHPNQTQNRGIRNCSQKTCIYTRKFKRNLRVYTTVKQKLAYRKKEEEK